MDYSNVMLNFLLYKQLVVNYSLPYKRVDFWMHKYNKIVHKHNYFNINSRYGRYKFKI